MNQLKIVRRKVFLFGAVLLFTSGSLRAQGNYSLYNYFAMINGTSNINTWNERIWKIWGNGDVKQNPDKSFTLRSLNIAMLVESIKCIDYPVMNSSTHKALKADKFPEITFALFEPIANLSYTSTAYAIMARGRLTIAGVTKEIMLPVKLAFHQDRKMTVEVEQKVKMTDFNIKPPTALFGLIKTGDLITINFTTTFLPDE